MKTRARTRFGNMPIVHEDKRYCLRYHIFYNEHLAAHVCVHHARWSGQTVNIYIWSLKTQSGGLAPKDMHRARKFIAAHQAEFQAAWDKAKKGQHPGRIP